MHFLWIQAATKLQFFDFTDKRPDIQQKHKLNLWAANKLMVIGSFVFTKLLSLKIPTLTVLMALFSKRGLVVNKLLTLDDFMALSS